MADGFDTGERVIVVGAGVIGLCCAVRLVEAGFETHVMARELPLETTSAVAGGLWLPYLAQPAHEVARWARATHEMLTSLVDEPAAGVRLVEGTLLHRRAQPRRPEWAHSLTDIVDLHEAFDPRPGFRGGWRATLPIVDTPAYLHYLVARFEQAGGIITRMPLSALPPRGVVVNATGVAARALARDWEVQPVRGQVVILDNPGIDEWTVHDEDAAAPTYILPRGDRVVVGGTAQPGEWDTTANLDTSRTILERAGAIEPLLRDARVRQHKVGLRPSRSSVRVELAPRTRGPDRKLIHCYGHGGSGFTLSWGCADDVLRLVTGLDQPLF